MRIERETAADHAIARRRRAIAEGAADTLRLKLAGSQRVDRQIPVAQNHSPDTDEIRPILPNARLGDMRQILLQIRVSAADEDALGTFALENARRFNLPRHADQRI